MIVWKPIPLNEIRVSSVEDGTRSLEYRRSIVFGTGSPGGAGTGRGAAPAQPRAVVDAVTITGTPGIQRRRGCGRAGARRWQSLRRAAVDRGSAPDRDLIGIAVTIASGSCRPTRGRRSTRVSLSYDIVRGPQTVIEIRGEPLPGDVLDQITTPGAAADRRRCSDGVRNDRARGARPPRLLRASVQFDFPPETATSPEPSSR